MSIFSVNFHWFPNFSSSPRSESPHAFQPPDSALTRTHQNGSDSGLSAAHDKDLIDQYLNHEPELTKKKF